jgi:hypothetical protein
MATTTLPLDTLTEASNGTHGPASQDGPTALLTTVTPQMAADWLATAHPNRPVSRSRVKRIARAIQAGLWQVNGQTLVLCPEFRLLDGRHRCLAIVDAQQSVETWVVVGIDPGCFATMDQGGKRSGADVLAIAGHPQAQTLCSALRWLWRYEHQCMTSASIALLDYELPTYLAQHPAIVRSLSWGLSLRTLVPPGVATMLHLLMQAKDPALAKAVFVSLAQGLELQADNPIYLVRERFLHERKELYHTAVVERAAVMVYAWNSRRQGVPMTQRMLKWSGDSAQFPTVE